MGQKRLHVIVRGRVQGVWYRGWTVREAERRGLRGWVRNRRDGSVEAVFAGEQRSGRNDNFDLIGALPQGKFRIQRCGGGGRRSMRPADPGSDAHAGAAQDPPSGNDMAREDADRA